MQHGDGKCPDCGGEMHLTRLPDVSADHFDAARKLAGAVWEAATLEEARSSKVGATISVACLTAALLFKRVAVTMRMPLQLLPEAAEFYLNLAHNIIQARRAEARAEREMN